MEEKRLQSIGIDLSSDFASIAYLENGSKLPVSMSMSSDDGKYVIPMTLYKKRNMEEWLIGDEAVFASENERDGKENLAEGVFQICQKGEVKYIEEREYTGEELLKKYMEILYEKARTRIGFSETERITVTVEKTDVPLVNMIRRICSALEIKPEKLRIIGHTEAFVFYVLSRKRELWANDVTLFSMDEDRFICQTMTMRKEKHKSTIFVEEEDLSGLVKYSRLKSEKLMQEADEAFCAYLKEDYKTHIVSSVFFTGIGFYENWYKKSISEICRKRRAFKGFNLYADGAAASVLQEGRTDLSLYCEGRTLIHVGIVTEDHGGEKDYMLSEAGRSWTEAGNKAEFLVDDTDVIKLVLTSPFHAGREIVEIGLEDFPDRRDKTLDIEISISYEGRDNFEITVEDKGFGDIFESSGKIIKKRISL